MLSPIFTAAIKLSFKSKLMARATPGLIVLTERPIAESASALIIPPCTNPAWLAMSSVAVISTTALPSPVSTTLMPSQVQAGARGSVSLLPALPLRHSHAGRRRPGDEPALLVQDIGFAEQQRLLHLDDAPDGAEAPLDHWAKEVDLELDRRVPHSVLLERGQRHAHRGIGDLRDHPALDHASAVTVLRSRFQLQDHAPGLGFGNPRSKRCHPPVRLCLQQLLRAPDI